MSDKIAEFRERFNQANKEYEQEKKKAEDFLRESDPDRYALIKSIVKIIWAGFEAFNGGWLSFIKAIGSEIVKLIRGKNND